jgi:TolA-binding protein
VLILRERVARLEKRLADVDARLGLLLARGDGGSRPPLRFDAPRGEQRAVDLGPGDAATGSVDIPRGEGRIDDRSRLEADDGSTDAAVDDIGVSDGDADGAPGIERGDPGDSDAAPAVLRLRGAPEGSSHGDGGRALAATAAGLYEWGQARLKEGRHAEAAAAFIDLTARFPKDPLADNAVYWTAFCHQARGEHRLAIDVWQKLALRFPRSDKIPDVLFGMARSHEALGEPALAETLYDELVHAYPQAERLKDAKKALVRLRPPR